MEAKFSLRSATFWLINWALVLMLLPEIGFSEGTFWITFSPHKFVVGKDNVFNCQVMDANTHLRIEGAQVQVTGPDFSFSGSTDLAGEYEYDHSIHPLIAGRVTIDITHLGYTPFHTGIMAQAGTADAWIDDCLEAGGMLPSWDINRNGIWDGPAIDCWPFDSPYIRIDTDP